MNCTAWLCSPTGTFCEALYNQSTFIGLDETSTYWSGVCFSAFHMSFQFFSAFHWSPFGQYMYRTDRMGLPDCGPCIAAITCSFTALLIQLRLHLRPIYAKDKQNILYKIRLSTTITICSIRHRPKLGIRAFSWYWLKTQTEPVVNQ